MGDKTTTYHYLNGALQLQTDGTNRLYFYYDADGTRLAVKYNGYLYHYYYNLQGDVIGLYDKYGNVVAQYTYDAWGNPLSVTDYNGTDLSGQPTHIANVNPFRYRGYYYDTETGLYYLNSRYYDPEVCRFISPDVLLDAGHVIGYNMYAYCGNNPVIRADDSGHFWDTVFDVVSLCLSVVDVVKNYDDPWAWAGLVGDVVDIIPFVTCAGEAIKGVGGVVRTINRIDNTVDTADSIYDTSRLIQKSTPSLPNKPPIIGENMERVRAYADSIGGHAYRPWRNFPFDSDLAMKRNKRWINDMMREGREIIDIGPDFARRRSGVSPSMFYNMERSQVKGYANYRKVFTRYGQYGGIFGEW